MELRHLRYFVAVAEELHFRRAAERLHVAQPAVSEQIRKLEAELGVQLLLRDQRSVALTPSGAAMLDEARRVLRQADVAQRAAREAHERILGRLRLGYLPDAVPRSLPRLLRRFAAVAPGIEVTLETGAARRLLEDVREQRIDLALICLPAPLAGLRSITISHERAVVAVPDGHPCAGQAEIALSGLANTRLVQLARAINPAFYDGVLGACRAAGIAPALMEIPEPALDQLLMAVACGSGVAVLPASVEARFAAPGVRFIPLAPPVPSYELAIVARPEPSTTTAAFLRLARRGEALPAPVLAVPAARRPALVP
jgi:DNA-binding transcriptional LysR family regulator